MTIDSVPPSALPSEASSATLFSCPKCGAPRVAADGDAPCTACGTSITVWSFTPLIAAAALAPGEGRCQSHPGKDAVDACERCGGYVCELCATRTGEHLFCPTCFDRLHASRELDTTVARRIRWDSVTWIMLLVAPVSPCNITGLVAIVTSCVTLRKRRAERYLSPVSSYVTLSLFFISSVGVAIAVAVAMTT